MSGRAVVHYSEEGGRYSSINLSTIIFAIFGSRIGDLH
jgi:hypothetical protein